ncbi:MAG: pyridoxal-phosphate dependent enzyme [Deltaproteobacteria bacterium]|nr:pyridoxal-phosphate dependent enzyme [Deltaproteobacteria bacterium]
MRALARHLPKLADRITWVELGDWPTPLTSLSIAGRPVWIKHEGDSHPLYGGNKLRTLEVWFGHARERGARRIWTIGAYGSNHAIATVLHAPRAGLDVGAILFPQPSTEWAVENCGALIGAGIPIVRVRSVLEMPFAAMRIARRDRDAVVMPPGGATPVGTLGAVSAAFELAEQIEAGLAPPPRRIVLAIGSACTTAGLLAGLALAHASGVWRWPVPIVHGVRVTPWPVTSRVRIAELAHRTLKRVATLGGPRVGIGLAELVQRLVVDRRELGDGYGRPTPRSEAAIAGLAGPRLDGVYSAKAAAALLRLHREGVGPLLFWATKSTAVLAAPSLDQLRAAPPAIVTWLG